MRNPQGFSRGKTMRADKAIRTFCAGALIASAAALTGCAPALPTDSGKLSSYANLKVSNGIVTKSKLRVEKTAVLAAKTLLLQPTIVDLADAGSGLSVTQRDLVSNAIDRSLCRNLSARFTIVHPGEPSDLVVRAVITRIDKTDTTAAGASVVAGIGSKVATVATGAPIPGLRIPIGLGSLSVEAEAKDAGGVQRAALVWARGADALTTTPRVAEEADAHTLADAFAADFAKLLVTGTDPIADPMPMMPTAQGIGEYFGKEPRYAACKQFGPDPGLGHTLGGVVGLPPSWTDKGSAKER